MFGTEEIVEELKLLCADLKMLPERVGQAVAGAMREEFTRAQRQDEGRRPEAGKARERPAAPRNGRKARGPRSARRGA